MKIPVLFNLKTHILSRQIKTTKWMNFVAPPGVEPEFSG